MRTLLKPLFQAGLRSLSSTWQPFSRLILAGDTAGWVLDWEMRALQETAARLGIRTAPRQWLQTTTPQAVFFASQFFLTDNPGWQNWPHRIGFSYFHGLPNTGDELFDRVFATLAKHHERLSRIQVSHTQMYETLLQTGIAPAKVFQIPIGINLDFFRFRDAGLRRQMRARLEIPEGAYVIGSFQKDGAGWGDGMEPKLIKGPDVFVETLARVRDSIPNLMVLLTGPARGYVKAGLERIGIPYRHRYLKNYPEVGQLFSALDLYLVSARQEGGPKAVLESMAAGVPLVTTRVGQAMDLVRHGENAWMVDVEDSEGLAQWIRYAYENRHALEAVLEAGRITAEENSYAAQTPLWRKFMEGFVEWDA